MLCCILKGTKIWIEEKKKKQRGGAKNSTVENEIIKICPRKAQKAENGIKSK